MNISQLKKNDYLWESMFAVAQAHNPDINFETVTPEELVTYYIKKQKLGKKHQYVEIVEREPVRALEIAKAVIENRKQKTTEVNRPSAQAQNIALYVDAGTYNNGQVGAQRTRISCVDAHDLVIFDVEIGDKTINEGEILAIVLALTIVQLAGCSAEIFSDSKIAVGWASKGKTKDAPGRDVYAKKAHDLLLETKSKLTWVPREQNKAGQFIERTYTKPMG